MNITKGQKRLFIFIVAVAVAVWVFLYYLYLPENDRLKKLKEEYGAAQDQISEYKKSIGDDKAIEKIITSLKKRLAELDNRIPDKEEMILREFSDFADKSGIELVYIRPDKKTASSEDAESIKGCIVQKMGLSVNLKTSYRSLGRFLKTLRDDFPVPLKIESVHMNRGGLHDSKSKPATKLDVNLQLVS